MQKLPSQVELARDALKTCSAVLLAASNIVYRKLIAVIDKLLLFASSLETMQAVEI
jgi:hypothetical protein